MFDIYVDSKLRGHRGAIYKIIQAKDPGSFFSAGGDGWIIKWNPNLSEDGVLIARDEDNIFTLCHHPDDALLAGTLQGNLLHIDLKNGAARKLVHHKKGLYDIHIWNEKIITLGGDGRLTFWDAKQLLPSDTYKISHKPIRRLAIHKERQLGFIACSDGDIYIMDLTSGKIVNQIFQAHQGAVFSLAFDRLGARLISGGLDAMLKVWDLDTFQSIAKLPAHWFTVNDIAVNSTLDLVATASRDKTIKIWNAQDLELLKVVDYQKFQTHQHSVNSIMWSNDGKRLISGSDDRTICVIDILSV